MNNDICGIYGYYDTLKDDLIYIGQSKHINQRHKQHVLSSYYDQQQINKILFNDKNNRYKLLILKECSESLLDYWEITLIALFNPKYNFAIGGATGIDNKNENHGMWNHDVENDTIEELYKKGWDSTQISNLFGVSRRTIDRRLHKIVDAEIIEETKKKRQSKTMKGRVMSEEQKLKLSEINKGKIVSEEIRQKISKSLKGKRHSKEWSQNISKALKNNEPRIVKAGKNNKGDQVYSLKYKDNRRIITSTHYQSVWLMFIALTIQHNSDDYDLDKITPLNKTKNIRSVIGPWNKGKNTGPLSDEHKQKLSVELKGKKRPEVSERMKCNQYAKGYKHSDESKKKISEAGKGRKHTEETKKKISTKNTGKNNGMYGKPAWNKGQKGLQSHPDKTKQKMSESRTKNNPRVIKKGRNRQGKQKYVIYYKGKVIKSSIFKEKLEKYLSEHYNEIIMQYK